MFFPYYCGPQAYGEALYRSLLAGNASAWHLLRGLQERQADRTLSVGDQARIGALNHAHARYASLRYAGAGAPSWQGYGLPTHHRPGISIGGGGTTHRTTLDAPTTQRLLGTLARCWRAPAAIGYASIRKDHRTMHPFPYGQEELPPSISGWAGLRPGSWGQEEQPPSISGCAGYRPMNVGQAGPAMPMPMPMMDPYTYQLALMYGMLQNQHEQLPPSIQGAYAGAGRGGGRPGATAPRPGGAAAFHAAMQNLPASHPFARFQPTPGRAPVPAAPGHPTVQTVFHPGLRRPVTVLRPWGGYPYYAGVPYPYPIDPAVYCPANGYYPR